DSRTRRGRREGGGERAGLFGRFGVVFAGELVGRGDGGDGVAVAVCRGRGAVEAVLPARDGDRDGGGAGDVYDGAAHVQHAVHGEDHGDPLGGDTDRAEDDHQHDHAAGGDAGGADGGDDGGEDDGDLLGDGEVGAV